MPINSQTSYWSGPILSAITLSCNIHTGRIGAISDQFALGTPWDEVRRTASQLAIQFRHAHGVKQPATLHEDELEYQEGWKERRARLERQFEVRPPLTFGNGNGHGNGHGAPAPPARAGKVSGRPDEID
jgi:fructose 1,6-bisphosphatase